MKILHIVSGSEKGGLYLGVLNLHHSLIKNNIISNILINNELIINNKLKKKFFFKTLYFNLIKFLNKIPKIFYLKRKTNAFNNSILSFNIKILNILNDYDIVHFHSFSEFFGNLSYIQNLNKPIIFTLRDMWLFTGGCHYSIFCKKYEMKCGSCINLNSKSKYDLSYYNQSIKLKKINKKIKIVAISQWLKNQAQKSSILRNNDITVIHNSINKNDFFPKLNINFKDKYNIPKNKKIILFGSQYLHTEYKGFNYFIKSLKLLNKKDFFILFFGNHDLKILSKLIKINFRSVGFINNISDLREIYSNSDLFVSCSIQEGFGKTAAESLFCGTPVVCFNETGTSEFIKHKKNGYLSNFLDYKDLANGIKWVASKKKKYFSKFIQKTINSTINSDKMVSKYINVYKKELIKDK